MECGSEIEEDSPWFATSKGRVHHFLINIYDIRDHGSTWEEAALHGTYPCPEDGLQLQAHSVREDAIVTRNHTQRANISGLMMTRSPNFLKLTLS